MDGGKGEGRVEDALVGMLEPLHGSVAGEEVDDADVEAL